MATSSARRSFDAVLHTGHKQCAVEVPFDPAEAWALSAQPLWPGRRGYRVRASCEGVDFDSAVVSRSRRFWLLIDDDIRRTAGWREGGELHFSLAPSTPAHA
jgi:Domain of unknown function (DUF1905)